MYTTTDRSERWFILEVFFLKICVQYDAANEYEEPIWKQTFENKKWCLANFLFIIFVRFSVTVP